MKNYEKHKTAQKAYNALNRFCKKQKLCRKCKYSNLVRKRMGNCAMRWLYDEAEADKNPTPQWQKNIMGKFTSKE